MDMNSSYASAVMEITESTQKRIKLTTESASCSSAPTKVTLPMPVSLSSLPKVNDNNSTQLPVSLTPVPAPTVMPTDEEIYEKDVPILSNTSQVCVSHYLLNLKFKITTRTVEGSVILMLKKISSTLKSSNAQNQTDVTSETEVDKIILDCCSIRVTNVEALASDTLNYMLNTNSSSSTNSNVNPDPDPEELYTLFQLKSDKILNFSVDKWSLSMWGWDPPDFPLAVRITYKTLPSSPSLQWRQVRGWEFKEDVPVCCYSPGTPVNNRGLFPCQEHPTAMATWQCFVETERSYTAFLSSDKAGVKVHAGTGTRTGIGDIDIPLNTNAMSSYQIEHELPLPTTTHPSRTKITYFNCSETLPMSTFTIIVSVFSPSNIIEIKDPRLLSSNLLFVPQRNADIYDAVSTVETMYPVSLIFQNDQEKFHNHEISNSTSRTTVLSISLLSSFVITLLEESAKLLGTLPFPRLDIIIMPDCFPTLGFANPNMIFLSPSVLSGSGCGNYDNNSLIFSRLAHELSHYWFGLSVGALDWNEEWLSEGFATFIQDVLQRRVLESTSSNSHNHVTIKHSESSSQNKNLQLLDLQLRPIIMLITLQQELENTSIPGTGAEEEGRNEQQLLCLPKGQGEGQDSDRPINVSWKNGLDPMKQLVQVHYLKGYFFLRELSDLVTEEKFLLFLRTYVEMYSGKLVTTNIFLEFFKNSFCTNKLASHENIDNCQFEGFNAKVKAIDSKTVDNIAKNWLNTPQLPEPHKNISLKLTDLKPTTTNNFNEDFGSNNLDLFTGDCIESISKVNRIALKILDGNYSGSSLDRSSATSTTPGPGPISAIGSAVNLVLCSNEKIILLEKILHARNNESESEPSRRSCHHLQFDIETLEKVIQPWSENPEVLHRWCEIIIKFEYTKKISVVKEFLLKHPAMGIFLFGELMISEKRKFQKLARKTYKLCEHVFDPPCKQVLHNMLF